ncbi:MAG: hypothetical protein L3J52_01475 [Proteobacteria bacterium]|nr:hypothetical protein [Pseudomonadota bacterium]
MKKYIILITLLSTGICHAKPEVTNSQFIDYDMAVENENVAFSGVGNIGSGFNYQGELVDVGSPANGNYDFSFRLFDALSGGSQVGENEIKGNRSVIKGLFSIEDVDFGDTAYSGDELWLSVTVRETGDPGSETTLSPRQKINAVPYAVQAEFSEGSSPWLDFSTGGVSGIQYTDGVVSIATNQTQASLNVDSDNGAPLRVRVAGATKFWVQSNGGTTIGEVSASPDDGLRVAGDVKQPLTSNGMIKYMVHASCGGSNPQSITKSYNGVSQAAITLVGGAVIPFSCRIKFPTEIASRYFQVTSIGSTGTTGQGATCRVLIGIGKTGDTLECLTFRTDTGAFQNGSIMVLVY